MPHRCDGHFIILSRLVNKLIRAFADFAALQGRIVLRNEVAVLKFGYHRQPTPEQAGAAEFIFWHFAQIQYKNPHVQLLKYMDISLVPYTQAFLGAFFVVVVYLAIGLTFANAP